MRHLGRHLDAANAVTTAGLVASVVGALAAAGGRPAAAVMALVVAGLCDLLDGLVARRLARDEDGRAFGARLDSLVDACAFGLAPTLLLRAAGMTSAAETVLLAAFACAAVWRLAAFDVGGLERRGDRSYYRGLPTTFVALVLPLALLAGLLGAALLRVAANVACAVLAVAMVSPIPVPKPRGAAYGVLALVALVMLAVYARVPVFVTP